jgi:hypothetical protein
MESPRKAKAIYQSYGLVQTEVLGRGKISAISCLTRILSHGFASPSMSCRIGVTQNRDRDINGNAVARRVLGSGSAVDATPGMMRVTPPSRGFPTPHGTRGGPYEDEPISHRT